MLQKQFKNTDEVSYNAISGVTSGRKVGRRTAAGVFFEVLQLKTWDFIEVNQEGSYGDITVSQGRRFGEGVPAGQEA